MANQSVRSRKRGARSDGLPRRWSVSARSLAGLLCGSALATVSCGFWPPWAEDFDGCTPVQERPLELEQAGVMGLRWQFDAQGTFYDASGSGIRSEIELGYPPLGTVTLE